jgi:TetR/AcrR family transcriptional repressor of mexJK operon
MPIGASHKIASRTPRKVPRGAQRRLELIAVAEQMFLERGFTDTTMQMIAERAGASKETLYRCFESKEVLFAEIVSKKAQVISGPDTALNLTATPQVVLTEFATKLLSIVLAKQGSSLFRTVVSEAIRNPELGDIFYERGPGLTVERLVAYIKAACKRGELRCADPRLSAQLFLGAVLSHYHLRRLVQFNWKSPKEPEIRRHVKAAVAMFLSCYGAR